MPQTDFAGFPEWLKTVEPHDLWRWVCDACWKDQLEGSQIEQAYLLSQKGVDMRTKLV